MRSTRLTDLLKPDELSEHMDKASFASHTQPDTQKHNKHNRTRRFSYYFLLALALRLAYVCDTLSSIWSHGLSNNLQKPTHNNNKFEARASETNRDAYKHARNVIEQISCCEVMDSLAPYFITTDGAGTFRHSINLNVSRLSFRSIKHAS